MDDRPFHDFLSNTPLSDQDTPLNHEPPSHGEHSLDHSYPLAPFSLFENASALQHDPTSALTGAGLSIGIGSLLAASQHVQQNQSPDFGGGPRVSSVGGVPGGSGSSGRANGGGGGGSAAWNPTPSGLSSAHFQTTGSDDFAAQLQQFVTPQPPTPRPEIDLDLAVHPDLRPDLQRLLHNPQPPQPQQQQSQPQPPDEHVKKKSRAKPKTKPAVEKAPVFHPVAVAALVSGVKGKWEGAGAEERTAKIRKSIEMNALSSGAPGPASGITTILCLHASAAQKSYGSEKRYLCPPPMVKIDGPLKTLALKPKLQMTVLSEAREAQVNERANVSSPHMRSFFRGLHVGGATAKGKSFALELSLHTPPAPSATHSELEQLALEGQPQASPLPPAFAAFHSSEIAVISKPSKKTAKARNTTSCILAGSTICLHNRINSQTVRTKYMTIDDGRLCARQSQWTAFSIHVLRRAEDTPGVTGTLATSKIPNGALTVTYGSEVLLTDLMTGISSEPLIVRKVEKKCVQLGAMGPVSQLQKLAFSRTSNGRVMYLSASIDGMDSLGNELKQSSPAAAPETGKKRKREDDDEDDMPSKPVLTYQYPKAVTPATLKDPESHEVDDLLTWTVTGIHSFSYSYFDAFAGSEPALPTSGITPFPTVSAPPEYNPVTHSISMSVSNFYSVVDGTKTLVPLEVWVGSIGPLKVHVGETAGAILALTTEDPDDKDASAVELPLESFLSVELPPTTEIVKACRPPELSDSTFEQLLAGASDFTVPTSSSSSSVDANFLNRSYAELANSMNVSTDPSSHHSLHHQFGPAPAELPAFAAASSRPSSSSSSSASAALHPQPPPLPALPQQPASLPIIFVRPSDGIGFMSSRWVVAEQLQDEDVVVAALLDTSNRGPGGASAPWHVRIV
ncbi:hypothetical protein RQP46_010356 [Phenoliferia psychrophenolica]